MVLNSQIGGGLYEGCRQRSGSREDNLKLSFWVARDQMRRVKQIIKAFLFSEASDCEQHLDVFIDAQFSPNAFTISIRTYAIGRNAIGDRDNFARVRNTQLNGPAPVILTNSHNAIARVPSDSFQHCVQTQSPAR